MRKIVLSSVVIAMLMFSGCSKEPQVQESVDQESLKQPVQEVEAVQTETVPAQNSDVLAEGSMSSADSNEMQMATLEKEMASIYFDFDQFQVRKDMQPALAKDAKVANDAAKNFNIKLEGNCDEWGSDEYNFALGLKRAKAVKNALEAEGVSSSRISMVSYGESNPVCNEKSKECWSKNRRVDLKLLP